MRVIALATIALGLSGCAANLSPTPAFRSVALPYSACGDMAALRTNLTGDPNPSARSDSELWSLGVRCLGEGGYSTVHARY